MASRYLAPEQRCYPPGLALNLPSVYCFCLFHNTRGLSSSTTTDKMVITAHNLTQAERVFERIMGSNREELNSKPIPELKPVTLLERILDEVEAGKKGKYLGWVLETIYVAVIGRVPLSEASLFEALESKEGELAKGIEAAAQDLSAIFFHTSEYPPFLADSAGKPVVLITGANTGLGLAAVKALCQSSNPYQILIGCRDVQKGEDAMNTVKTEVPNTASTLSVVQVDVASDESIQKAADHVSAQYGRVNVLVNNAGAQLDAEVERGR